MWRRWLTGTLVALIALLALTTSAVAGGWATVEMDEPVTRTEVDQEMTLEFILLQHGNKPTDWTTTYFQATNAETGETLRVNAVRGDETGRWTVQVAFPSAGTWDWAIKTDELHVEDTFPAIEVVGKTAVAGTTSGVTALQLDSAITSTLAPLNEQISTMRAEIDDLNTQIVTLTGERDTLQQVANLEAAQSNQPETSSTSWWVAALTGALAALIVVSSGGWLAMRHGLIQRRELAPTTA